MSDLEVLDRAVSYTTNAYINAFGQKVVDGEMDEATLEQQALNYSANVLIKALNDCNGGINEYTRKNNLRFDVANIGISGIKNQLLKNIVSVATYNRVKDTRSNKHIGTAFNGNLTDDDIAVIFFNNLSNYGVERGYDLLNNSNILLVVCRLFAYYRRPNLKEELDEMVKKDKLAQVINDQLDVYYARYGDLINNRTNHHGVSM